MIEELIVWAMLALVAYVLGGTAPEMFRAPTPRL
jgi:hypothetical protein